MKPSYEALAEKVSRQKRRIMKLEQALTDLMEVGGATPGHTGTNLKQEEVWDRCKQLLANK